MIKILNLYAGIGGNRKLWPDEEIEVTAVEINHEICNKYKSNFPNDKIIWRNAHKYLLEHYNEFDFIWSSPPCQTHSRTNYFLNAQGIIRYIDMKLYQEVLFLQKFFKGKWVIENVIPYYEPLIKPKIIGRHCFWSNFNISKIKQPKDDIGKMCGKNQKAHNKLLEERNMINPKLGLHVFNCAFKEKQQTLK